MVVHQETLIRIFTSLVVLSLFACSPAPIGLPPDSGNPVDGGAPDEGDAGNSDGGVDAGTYDAGAGLAIILGTDPLGGAHNAPADWPEAAASWNASTAEYSPVRQKIAFHVHRPDIVGGSIRPGPDAGITAYGISEYYVAGPGTGSWHSSDTSEIYLSNPDGTLPTCITCEDLVDGQNGVAIYAVDPSVTSTPAVPHRQTGFTLYANQNKDLPVWNPAGTWLVLGVEMPRHALEHASGTSETAFFVDLWAVTPDGKTWVQLTDFAGTWAFADDVAVMPYACADPHCPAGCQYKGTDAGQLTAPYDAYSCSAVGQPPPASGLMRPAVSRGLTGDVAGTAKVVWGERVGLSPLYNWGGTLQLAKADLLFSGGIPTLVNYEHNLTPTPSTPSGKSLWSNPGGIADIGAGYEAWGFSEDGTLVGVATDAFHSSSSPSVKYFTSHSSLSFTDSTAWGWSDTAPAFADTTRYDAFVYPYQDNGAAYPVSKCGHWEEPTVFSRADAPVAFIAFASSANLTPPWNPSNWDATFGLETWVVRQDRAAPAQKLTQFNDLTPGHHLFVYPTDANPVTHDLYLNVVPTVAGQTNPPGAIYTLHVPAL